MSKISLQALTSNYTLKSQNSLSKIGFQMNEHKQLLQTLTQNIKNKFLASS